MMLERRPPVLLNNDGFVELIREYYTGRDPNHFLTKRIAHPGTALYFHTIWAFEDGAKEEIADHSASGGRTLMTPEHVKWSDPFVKGAIVHEEESMKQMEANSVFVNKAELSRIPLVGWLLAQVGGKPALREKDADKRQFKPAGTPEERQARIHILGDVVVDMMIEAIDRGRDGLVFVRPERREKGDESPIEIDKLRLGAGRIALGVARPEELMLIPAATDYGRGSRDPSVFFGRPIKAIDAPTPLGIMELLVPRLQYCVEQAARLAEDYQGQRLRGEVPAPIAA